MVNAGKDCAEGPEQIADANLRAPPGAPRLDPHGQLPVGWPAARRRLRAPRRHQPAQGQARRRPLRAVEPVVLSGRQRCRYRSSSCARTSRWSATPRPVCRSRRWPRSTSPTFASPRPPPPGRRPRSMRRRRPAPREAGPCGHWGKLSCRKWCQTLTAAIARPRASPPPPPPGLRYLCSCDRGKDRSGRERRRVARRRPMERRKA